MKHRVNGGLSHQNYHRGTGQQIRATKEKKSSILKLEPMWIFLMNGLLCQDNLESFSTAGYRFFSSFWRRRQMKYETQMTMQPSRVCLLLDTLTDLLILEE